MIKISKIKGNSMSPSFLEGDFIFSISQKLVKLKIGDVIVFNHIKLGFLIKEICSKNKDGYFVKGINSQSTDSETIGLITSKMIKGKVFYKI